MLGAHLLMPFITHDVISGVLRFLVEHAEMDTNSTTEQTDSPPASFQLNTEESSEASAVAPRSFRSAQDLRQFIDSKTAVQIPSPSESFPAICFKCRSPLRGIAYGKDGEEGCSICEDCFVGLGADGVNVYIPQEGISVCPPQAENPDTQAEQKLHDLIDSLITAVANEHQQTYDAAHDAARRGGGTAPTLADALLPGGTDALGAVQHVVTFLQDLSVSGFAGSNILLRACQDPLRTCVMQMVPAQLRLSTADNLQLPDLQHLPREVLERMQNFVETQASCFLGVPEPPRPEVQFDIQYCDEADASNGHTEAVALAPNEAFLAQLASSQEARLADEECGGGGGGPLGSEVVEWVFGLSNMKYSDEQLRSLHLRSRFCGSLMTKKQLADRFQHMLREASSLANERAELKHIQLAVKEKLEWLLKNCELRPAHSRARPRKGDLDGASPASILEVLEWEDKLCEAMWFKHEVDTLLGKRRIQCAQDKRKMSADKLANAQRSAEEERQRDEEEHRKSMRSLHKMRGSEGERQRAQLGDTLEHRRMLRQHDLQSQQAALHQLEAKARSEVDTVESARKQRDSLQGWRDHLNLALSQLRSAEAAAAEAAAAGGAPSSPPPPGAPQTQSAVTNGLLKNNREMFYFGAAAVPRQTPPDRSAGCFGSPAGAPPLSWIRLKASANRVYCLQMSTTTA